MSSRWRIIRQVNSGGNVSSHWRIDVREKLGAGDYGSVSLATSTGTGVAPAGVTRAIKAIPKKKTSSASARVEIECLWALDHPHICKLYETFEDDDNFYLVMENLSGGTLQQYHKQHGALEERQVALVIRQLLQAVGVMQAMLISHNDLLARNVALQRQGPIEGNTIKIIDFGAAGLEETPKNELWSCGCLMHYLLSAREDTASSSDAKVKIGDVMLKASTWQRVSQNAKSFAGLLLKKNPTSRSTPKQALRHSWLQFQPLCGAKLADTLNRVPELLLNYQRYNPLKRAALVMMADQLDTFAHFRLQSEVFECLDVDADGLLNLNELLLGLTRAGVKPPPNLQGLLESIDLSGIGILDRATFLAATFDQRLLADADPHKAVVNGMDVEVEYEEKFYAATLEMQQGGGHTVHYLVDSSYEKNVPADRIRVAFSPDGQELCRAAFAAFDKKHNGKLSHSSIMRELECSAVEADLIIHGLSRSGDGCINFKDFCSMFQDMPSELGLEVGFAVLRAVGKFERTIHKPEHMIKRSRIASALSEAVVGCNLQVPLPQRPRAIVEQDDLPDITMPLLFEPKSPSKAPSQKPQKQAAKQISAKEPSKQPEQPAAKQPTKLPAQQAAKQLAKQPRSCSPSAETPTRKASQCKRSNDTTPTTCRSPRLVSPRHASPPRDLRSLRSIFPRQNRDWPTIARACKQAAAASNFPKLHSKGSGDESYTRADDSAVSLSTHSSEDSDDEELIDRQTRSPY